MSSLPRPLRVRSRDVWVVLANLGALVLGVALLWELRTVVTWVLVSIFLALALRPIVVLLMRHRVRKGLAVAIVAVTIAGIFALLIGTLVPMLVAQARLLVENAPDLVNRVERWDPVRWVVQRLGQDYEPETLVRDRMHELGDLAWTLARGVFKGFIGAITITTLTIFMLLFGGEIVEKALAWFPPQRREHVRMLAYRMTKVVGGYVAGTLIVASIGGVVMGVTLAILGVPYFLPLGLAMILLGIIPYLGSFIGAIMLIGLTFASEGWRDAAICGAVYFVYQRVENEILHPLVQRRTIRMNALFVALALLAGAVLGGVVGTLLALPVAGAIQIVLGDALDRRRARFGEEPKPREEPEPPHDHPEPSAA